MCIRDRSNGASLLVVDGDTCFAIQKNGCEGVFDENHLRTSFLTLEARRESRTDRLSVTSRVQHERYIFPMCRNTSIQPDERVYNEEEEVVACQCMSGQLIF